MTDSAIRPMQLVDVEAVVAIHLQAFEDFFLSFLGKAFLSELYAAVIADTSGITFVYDGNGQVQGFVAGTDQPAGFYRRLLQQRWWRFALASVAPVLKRPTVIPRLLRAFTMPEQAAVEEGCGTLMSIAVSPEVQSQGIGRILVRAFLQEAIHHGLKQVNLTTDKLDNDATNAFYQNLGFVCVRDYVTPEGREMNEYLINL